MYLIFMFPFEFQIHGAKVNRVNKLLEKTKFLNVHSKIDVRVPTQALLHLVARISPLYLQKETNT